MTVSYKWTDASQSRLLKVEGSVRTCFKVAVDGPAKAAYEAWLSEGNTPLPPDKTDLWEEIRQKRDQLIRDSDWTMIPGATVDQAQWAAYRQILRDLPQTYSNPEDVVWPTTPSTSGPNTIEE